MFPSKNSVLGMPGWLMLIAVMTAIGPVAIDLYLPAFPLIEATFKERGVERTMASYLLGLAIGQLFYGPVSDRFGRKPPLYFGFALFCVGSVGCMLAQNMTMLMLGRIVQAVGACSGMAIGRAVVRDRCEPEQAARAFSMLMTIVSLAPILAPVAGGFIVTVMSWRANFVIQATMGFGILIAMHVVMTESLDAKHVRPLHVARVFRTYFDLLRHREFLSHTLIGGFGMASLITYVSGAPTILTDLFRIPPSRFGWIIGLNGLAFMLASRLNLWGLRNKKPKDLLAGAIRWPTFCGLLLVATSFWSGAPLWAVIALQFCFFISTARVMPNASALALAQHARDAGSASALMGALQSLIATLAGLILSSINNGKLAPLAILMTVCAIASWSLQRWSAAR